MKVILDVNLSTKDELGPLVALFERMQAGLEVVLITGGTKYEGELGRHGRLLRQINSFSRKGKTNRVDKRPHDRIDERELALRNAIEEKIGEVPQECDDLHLLALCSDANASVIFSKDNRLKHCIQKIRNVVGHKICPNPTFVRNIEDFKNVFGG